MKSRALIVLLLGAALLAASGKFQVESESPRARGTTGFFSPNMKYVAFTDPSTITVRSLDTGQEKKVKHDGHLGLLAALSPDGRFLYHLAQSERRAEELWRIDVGTGASRHILSHVGLYPALSADGTQFAFPRDRGIMLVSSDGTNLRRLCDHCGYFRMIWSPDGASLIAEIERGVGNVALSQISTSTGAVTVLPGVLPPGTIDHPAWPAGADGVFFMFFRDSDRRKYRISVWNTADYTWADGQIWFCPVPGGNPYQVTQASPGYDEFFGALPDGPRLIVRRNTFPPGYWELTTSFFGSAVRPEPGAIVELRLKK